MLQIVTLRNVIWNDGVLPDPWLKDAQRGQFIRGPTLTFIGRV